MIRKRLHKAPVPEVSAKAASPISDDLTYKSVFHNLISGINQENTRSRCQPVANTIRAPLFKELKKSKPQMLPKQKLQLQTHHKNMKLKQMHFLK